MASIAHLFYSTKKVFVSAEMEKFCNSTESCRRKLLIESVGGSVQGTTSEFCCNNCSDYPTSSRLDIFGWLKVKKRKRRRAVRTVKLDLKEKLKLAHAEFLQQHPPFEIVGLQNICPDSSILKLCEEARFISSIDDFPIEIRLELKHIFFRVIQSSSLP